MLNLISLASGVMKLFNALAGMFRDARLRQDGKNEIAAESALQAAQARNKAQDRVKTYDDAVALAVSKLPDGGDK